MYTDGCLICNKYRISQIREKVISKSAETCQLQDNMINSLVSASTGITNGTGSVGMSLELRIRQPQGSGASFWYPGNLQRIL